MADKTKIEWTDATWNIITGCTLVDAGCTNCYAAHLIASWPAIGNHPSRKGLARKNAAGVAKFTGEVRFNEAWLDQPLRWKKPRRIFVCAHGDLFHESVPDEWLDRVFAVMALCPQHTFQVLSKRPERMREYVLGAHCDGARRFVVADAAERIANNFPIWDGNGYRLWDGYAGKAWDQKVTAVLTGPQWPLPNVWLGTSVSDQASAAKRIPDLLATPAAVRLLSMEPLLGPVDLTKIRLQRENTATERLNALDTSGIRSMTWWKGEHIPDAVPHRRIDWLIVGGESGPGARPMHPDWARSLRDQCNAAGVPFFFKQWGEWAPLDTTADRAARITGQTPRAQWHDAYGLITDSPAKEDPLTFFSEGQVFRIGKKAAGRLLDGREWNEMPGVAHG